MKKLLLLFLCITLFSCSENKNETRDKILDSIAYHDLKTKMDVLQLEHEKMLQHHKAVESKNNTISAPKETPEEKEAKQIDSILGDIKMKSPSLNSIKKRFNKDVADRPLLVADYLETAAKLIKSEDIRYNWVEQGSCNMGLITQLVTGLTPLQIEKHIGSMPLPDEKYGKDSWTWSGAATQYCPLTGQDMPTIFRKLFSIGFEREDIGRIEYLSTPRIIKLAGIDNKEETYYTEEENVIKYYLTWAKEIRKYRKTHTEVVNTTKIIAGPPEVIPVKQSNFKLVIDTFKVDREVIIPIPYKYSDNSLVDTTTTPRSSGIRLIDSPRQIEPQLPIKIRKPKTNKFKSGNVCPE